MADLPLAPLETERNRHGQSQLTDAAFAFAQSGMSENTRRAFRSSFRSFLSWCASVDRRPLPADAATVAEYVTARALENASVSTLALHIAAIRKAHQLRGLPPPTGSPLDEVWEGIRYRCGRPPARKRAVTMAQLRKFVLSLDVDSLSGLRDKAILLICFAGAMRRSELVMLQLDGSPGAVVRARFVDEGVEIYIDRSKGDQVGKGAVVAIPYGQTELCPVAALSAWLRAAKINGGCVFRRVDRRDRVVAGSVSDRYIARLVQREAKRAGLDARLFGAHSLRAGLATEASKRGVALQTISGHLRHAKLETTMIYIRDGERFKRNAAGKVGL